MRHAITTGTRAFIAAAVLTAATTLGGLATLAPTRPSQAADPAQAARTSVGKPVQQAQQLLREKKLTAALAKLGEADSVPDKSAYERYVIEETRAAAETAAGDYAAAAHALEAVLATGVLPPAEAVKRRLALVQLAYQIKDYPKLVLYAEGYYKSGGADPEPRLLMAQAHYAQNDFADAAQEIRRLLQSDQKAGTAPSENLLLMLASSEFKRADQPAYVDALERLVAVYPKPQYWTELLAATAKRPGFAHRLELDLDRLMVATGAMDAADQYTAAAELALQAGFPGDAKSFLASGYAAGILGKGGQAERQKRLADMAQRQSAEDQKSLTQLRTEADAAGNGLASEKLGEAYASYGRYDDAAAAILRAIQKGGLKYPEDATLHLGVAYLRAGAPAKAKPVLQGITGTDGVAALARLWLLQGGAK